jgi:CxxC-x17-CxxC domain-containing protein
MFSATCASCHKPCEVPFRPTSGKPVYCNNCFRGHNQSSGDYGRRGDRDGRERFPKRDFTSSSFSKSQTDERQIDILKKQLDSIDSKLDKIMRIVGVEQPLISKAVKLPEKEVDKTTLKTIVLNATGTDKKNKKKPAKKKSASKKK